MDEAKDLYKKIMKENKSVGSTRSNEDKIKSVSIPNMPTSQEPLYETAQVKRWKKLSGQEPINNEE